MTHGIYTRFAVTLALMVPIGFALGTVVLLGPVRWITNALRTNGAPSSVESLAVVAIIIALVLVTAAIAWAASGPVLGGRTLAKIAIPLVALGFAGAAWALWMDTSMVASLGASAAPVEVTPGFTFGPYPELADLKRLQEEGYTGVISLLHPAVVPFEPQLLEREREATTAAGIPLIHLPMLPWVSSNDESLSRLAQLAKEGDGRYYVHCYLGRDRVRLAQRVIEASMPQHARVDASGMSAPIAALADGKRFERGVITKLSENVMLGPYPTPEEFATYIVVGNFDHVVSLMAPDDEGATKRIADEQAYLQPFPVTFTTLPLGNDALTTGEVAEAVAKVQSLEGRVYVHSFFSIDDTRGRTAKAFAAAFPKSNPTQG